MIPKRIRPFFVTTLQKMNGENTLIEGTLTCCNSHNFEVYAVGKTKHSVFSKMSLFPKDNQLVVEVRCKKCGKVILVFDSDCDGYEQCGNNQYSHTSTESVGCKKCSDNDFSVDIRYEYTDVQELEELKITEIDNSFTWIWITLECNKCGAKHKNFVDFEIT